VFQIQIEKILKNSDLAVTKNRRKVLKVFLKVGKPLDLKTIKSSIANIDRVTLFRILSAFEDCQIIHAIHLDSGDRLYALCNQECSSGEKNHTHNHIHFQCEDCSDVICLPVDTFPVVNIPNYIVNQLNINASGVCANCNL
jgi:Fur family ferric uptake transcriptional regulator